MNTHICRETWSHIGESDRDRSSCTGFRAETTLHDQRLPDTSRRGRQEPVLARLQQAIRKLADLFELDEEAVVAML